MKVAQPKEHVNVAKTEAVRALMDRMEEEIQLTLARAFRGVVNVRGGDRAVPPRTEE